MYELFRLDLHPYLALHYETIINSIDDGSSSPIGIATTQRQRRQGYAIYYTLNVYNITNWNWAESSTFYDTIINVLLDDNDDIFIINTTEEDR